MDSHEPDLLAQAQQVLLTPPPTGGPDAEATAFTKFQCDERLVLCVDEEGNLLKGEKKPEVRPQEALTVLVIGRSGEVSPKRITLTSTTVPLVDVLVQSSPPGGKAAAMSPPDACTVERGLKQLGSSDLISCYVAALDSRCAASRPPLEVLVQMNTGVSSGDYILLQFHRDPDTTAEGAFAKEVSASIHIDVSTGRYALEPAVLVPFVYAGDRTVSAATDLATGERRVVVGRDIHVTAAIAANVFPWGRRRSVVFSRTWQDYLGFQLGTNLDLAKNPFGEWYLGVVCEPVSGISINLGLALLKGDFVPAGYHEGQVVPAGQSVVPDRHFMLAPYIGVTATPDILTTLSQALKNVTALE